jgi:uncharacterized membrane protein (DUF2068 family)
VRTCSDAPRQEALDVTSTEKRALGLYAIIAFKLLKGTLLLALALGVYSLVDDDLPAQFGRLLRVVRIDPERQFFEDLAAQLALVPAATVGWVATGTLFYSLFSLVEGVGLTLRLRWAGRLAIGESAFFVPIEVHHLIRNFSLLVLGILLLNLFIVYYLYRHRHRLFDHHH